jgi:osmoprotectant transport system permease protein
VKAVHNPPLALLVALFMGCTQLGFLTVAPNRLLSGRPVALFAATGAGSAVLLVAATGVLLACVWLRPRRTVSVCALAAGCLLLCGLVMAAGAGSAVLAAQNPAAVRIGLGGGFWGMGFCVSLAIVDALRQLRAGVALRLLVLGLLLTVLATIAATGELDTLSLAREYVTQRGAFGAALLRHLLLVFATLGIVLLLGLPLGIAVQRRVHLRRPVFAVLNVVQTVPSLALFGLLVAPLAAVGLSGIGVVPALTALVGYALLPIVRNTVAGLDGVDAATRDAAVGMGLSPVQVLVRVDLPLAAPALLAGLRIVVVQTVGLAVVAALIGAGGLGAFIFQGLGQYATDLVLLGALPAIFLALAADVLLQLGAEMRGSTV